MRTLLITLGLLGSLSISSAQAQTAKCSDGWASNSEHFQGTCSYQGGVSVWLSEEMKAQANQWCDYNPSRCESSHWEGIAGHGNHPADAADDRYGAIAWDRETGRSGWSWEQSTAAKAREMALSNCGTSGCEVVMESAARQCSALATTEDRKHIGAAWRTTQHAAALAAIANCEKAESVGCVVRFSKCNE
jgi:hypothetical protein